MRADQMQIGENPHCLSLTRTAPIEGRMNSEHARMFDKQEVSRYNRKLSLYDYRRHEVIAGRYKDTHHCLILLLIIHILDNGCHTWLTFQPNHAEFINLAL